jgi:hypothetical protein
MPKYLKCAAAQSAAAQSAAALFLHYVLTVDMCSKQTYLTDCKAMQTGSTQHNIPPGFGGFPVQSGHERCPSGQLEV